MSTIQIYIKQKCLITSLQKRLSAIWEEWSCLWSSSDIYHPQHHHWPSQVWSPSYAVLHLLPDHDVHHLSWWYGTPSFYKSTNVFRSLKSIPWSSFDIFKVCEMLLWKYYTDMRHDKDNEKTWETRCCHSLARLLGCESWSQCLPLIFVHLAH